MILGRGSYAILNFADFTIRSEFNRFALKMTSLLNCTRLGHLRLMPIRCRLGIQKCLHSVKSPNESKCTAVSRVQEGSILELFVAFWRFSGTSKHTWKVEEVDFSGFKGRGPRNSKIRFSFVAISSCGSTRVSGG